MVLTIQERLKGLHVERCLTLEHLVEQTCLSESALGLMSGQIQRYQALHSYPTSDIL